MPFINVPLPLSIWTSAPKRSSLLTPRPHVNITTISPGFGLPPADDDDPFGVLALEKAGLEIKEAGTKSRPSSDAFEYKPSPSSPIFPAYRRSLQSLDGISMRDRLRDSRRDSKRSFMSVDHGTQTAILSSPIEEPASIFQSPKRMDTGNESPIKEEPEHVSELQRKDALASTSPVVEEEKIEEEEEEEEEEEDEDQLEDEPEIIIEKIKPIQIVPRSTVISQAVTSPMISHAKLVSIPKRLPPALPARNPLRARPREINTEEANAHLSVDFRDDSSSIYSASPSKSAFDSYGETSPRHWSEQTSIMDDDSLSRKGSFHPDKDIDEQNNETEEETMIETADASFNISAPETNSAATESKHEEVQILEPEPRSMDLTESNLARNDAQALEINKDDDSLEKRHQAVDHALTEKISSPRLRPIDIDYLKPNNVLDMHELKDNMSASSVYGDEVPSSKDEDVFHSVPPSPGLPATDISVSIKM